MITTLSIPRTIVAPLLLLAIFYNQVVYSESFSIDIGSSRLDVEVFEANEDYDEKKFRQWITESAHVVSDFYGKFPVDRAKIDLNLFPGGGFTGGRAYGETEARVSVTVGIYNEPNDLRKDWRLVHELIHLAFPRVPRTHHWIVEGLATYLESISRCRSGQIDPQFMWQGFKRGLPNGLPEASETGLDGSTRWGRIYWGGALFALVADIRIRQQTKNQSGLVDALNGILAAGLDHRDESELLPLFKLADEATNTRVLQNLYSEAGSFLWEPDLEQLWIDLGVNNTDTFNDDAPLASIRRDITDH